MPGVIYKNEFHPSSKFHNTSYARVFSGFKTYTEATKRESGVVDPDNDYDIVKEKEFAITHPEERFKSYLEYTARASATHSKDNSLLPTFNGESYHVSAKESFVIEHRLKEAWEQDGMLWSEVLSFTNEELIKNNIYNPTTKHLDQRRLKDAVQAGMPTLLKQEGLASDTTWWGNIHLNTEHIHIHLGIVALPQQANKKMTVDGQEQIRGKFTPSHLEGFKNRVWRNLENSQSRNQEVELERESAILREDVKNAFKTQLQELHRDHLLQSLIKVLPDDQKHWRFGSNAYDMRAANQLANLYVEHQLAHDLKDEYQAYQSQLQQQASLYQDKSTDQTSHYVDNRVKELKSSMIDRLYSEFKELDQSDLKKDVFFDLKQNPLTENQQTADALKQSFKELKSAQKAGKDVTSGLQHINQQLKYYQFAIRHQNLEQEGIFLKEEFSRLNQLDHSEISDFKIEQAHQRLYMNHLATSSKWQLTQGIVDDKEATKLFGLLKNEQKQLNLIYQSVDQLPINELNEELYQKRVDLINEEIALINQSDIDDVMNCYQLKRKNEVKTLINSLDQNKETLSIKREIKSNNDQISQLSKDDPSIDQLKQLNGRLFNRLKSNTKSGKGHSMFSNTQQEENQANDHRPALANIQSGQLLNKLRGLILNTKGLGRIGNSMKTELKNAKRRGRQAEVEKDMYEAELEYEIMMEEI